MKIAPNAYCSSLSRGTRTTLICVSKHVITAASQIRQTSRCFIPTAKGSQSVLHSCLGLLKLAEQTEHTKLTFSINHLGVFLWDILLAGTELEINQAAFVDDLINHSRRLTTRLPNTRDANFADRTVMIHLFLLVRPELVG